MINLQKFIKDCDCFFVVTNNKNYPAARPFGAIMKIKNTYYIATNKTKSVYKQIIKNNRIQILAIKRNTRNWIRVSCSANDKTSLVLAKTFFKQCPRLSKIYKTIDNPNLKIFELKIINFEEYKS